MYLQYINIKSIVSGSYKVIKMCVFLCIIDAIVRIITTILLMMDSMIRMCLYNLYSIFSVCCQIFSAAPLCIVFIVTSNLKCLLCNRSNICCAGSQAQCPLLTTLTTILILIIVLYSSSTLDPILNELGYVRDRAHKETPLKRAKLDEFGASYYDTHNITSTSKL